MNNIIPIIVLYIVEINVEASTPTARKNSMGTYRCIITLYDTNV